MKTVKLVEQLNYPSPMVDHKPTHHSIACEIASRLQEMDELLPGTNDHPPGGIRMISRLASVSRKSRRAYRLLLDLLSKQDALTLSLHDLAKGHLNGQGHPCKRQAWLQNSQKDVELITEIWPEVGAVLAEVMQRRPIEEEHESNE